MITLQNMIFVNPQAYRVFPQIGNPYNTGITDTAIYEGYLQVTDQYGTTKSFTNTNTIDFTGFKGVIDIDQYTDTGSVKLGRWRITDTIENDIMSSMVLWYDLAKQGATNESMAADPRLIDHSGNGHHATCYNFAWSGMSGVGGYVMSFLDITADIDAEGRTVTYNKIVFYKPSHVTKPYSYHTANTPSFKVNVNGLSDSEYEQLIYYYKYQDGVEKSILIYDDGEYIIPESFNTTEGTGSSTGFVLNGNGQTEVIIEQLPLYPHALVSDGVDDYVRTYNLPILNDYTLFFNKKFTNTLASGTSILSDGSYNSDYTLGYTYDTYPNHSEDYFHFDSFGYHNEIGDYIQSLDIITPTSFNDHKITRGSGIASRTMLSVGAPYSSCPMAFYGLIVFNRTLSDSEIEWVKTNLITNGQ